MKASKIVQMFVKYPHNPIANHFSSISMTNIIVKIRLSQNRAAFKSGLLSKCLSSKARVMLDAKIKVRIIHWKRVRNTINITKSISEIEKKIFTDLERGVANNCHRKLSYFIPCCPIPSPYRFTAAATGIPTFFGDTVARSHHSIAVR